MTTVQNQKFVSIDKALATTNERARPASMKQLKTTRRGKLKNSFKDQCPSGKSNSGSSNNNKNTNQTNQCGVRVCKRKRRSDATRLTGERAARKQKHTHTKYSKAQR